MTGTASRYIALKFTMTIVGMFVLCLVLIFFVDMIELLRVSGKYGEVPLYMLLFLALLRLWSYAEMTLPFAVLIGSIGAFLMLSRSSELVVLRSVGMSVWQFILPGTLLAFMIGVLAVTVYDPMAARARAYAEDLYANAFGRQSSLLETKDAGAWLREDGADGQSVIHASVAANHGLTLSGVSVFQFNPGHGFEERIEAKKAVLKDGRWELEDAWVSAVGREPSHHNRYLVSTHLSPAQVSESLGSIRSISFWELPKFIALAERAGLPAVSYKLHYQQMLAEPLLLAVMALLAATCSLKAFRFGNIQAMAVTGLGAGFVFFIAIQISKKLGESGLVSPALAAWAPLVMGALLSLTVLLHQEDG